MDFWQEISSRRIRRREQARFVRLSRQLRRAQQIATSIDTQIWRGETDDLPVDFAKEISSLADLTEHVAARSYFARAYYESAWWERLLDVRSDPFLLAAMLAFLVAIPFAVYLLIQIVTWLSASTAHAEPVFSDRSIVNENNIVLIMSFVSLFVLQTFAFASFIFSKKADVRAFAADFLKMSLGIYIGTATKFIKS